MNKKLTKAIARKVLEVVDAGLSRGVGKPVPGKMCVEAAVCYALGEKHGDRPSCVSPAVRALKISLNDTDWSSRRARAKGLRRLAIAQLGTKSVLDDREFARRVSEYAIRVTVPIALLAAASIQKDVKQRDALRAAANKCEVEGTGKSAADAAVTAAITADATVAPIRAAVTAKAAARAAARAAAAAVRAAVTAKAAARAAAKAAARAAAAVKDAADAAVTAAITADGAKNYDKIMSEFAEGIVQILIDMKSPGTKWLDLTESS